MISKAYQGKMAKSSTSWKKGMSGNPKGRPPKSRALSNLLASGARMQVVIPADGERPEMAVPAGDVLVQNLWEGVTTGKITFPDGRVMVLEASDMVAFSKMLMTQIDGPAPAALDVTSGGKPVGIQLVEVIKSSEESS